MYFYMHIFSNFSLSPPGGRNSSKTWIKDSAVHLVGRRLTTATFHGNLLGIAGHYPGLNMMAVASSSNSAMVSSCTSPRFSSCFSFPLDGLVMVSVFWITALSVFSPPCDQRTPKVHVPLQVAHRSGTLSFSTSACTRTGSLDVRLCTQNMSALPTFWVCNIGRPRSVSVTEPLKEKML